MNLIAESLFKITRAALGMAIFLLLSGCSTTPTEIAESEHANNHLDYRGSWAQVPVILSRIQPPSFPNRQFDVSDAPYGAIADGVSDARGAVQQAIIDVSRYGGGTVTIPQGTYLIDGPLQLENNVNLHLEEGAELRFGTTYEKYLPQVLTRYEGTDIYNFSPLIYVYQKKNVAITGKGTLNGQSEHSWSTWVAKAADEALTRISGSAKNDAEQATRDMNNANTPMSQRNFDRSSKLRPAFILFYDSEDILLEGVNIIDSPFWVNHFYMSKNITVRNMTMRSLNKNNDGIDIESSEDIHIHNVDFATGDDGIAIKSGRDWEGLRKMIPSKNIVVQDVRFLADDAIALGSEASGGVRNVFIENSEGSKLRKGFFFKANRNRGSQFEHIRIRNITIGDLADLPENSRKLNMIEITTDYDSDGVKYNRHPTFKDIRMENIQAGTSRFPLSIVGTDASPIRDFVLDNVHLGSGEEPSVIRGIDDDTVFFREVTVDRKPLAAQINSAGTKTVVQQADNIPPDVYAGEERVLSLAQENSIRLSGDAKDVDGDPMTYEWIAVDAEKELVPIGKDSVGNPMHFPFGDEQNVTIARPVALSTSVIFSEPGTYRIRLTASDGKSLGYHTVFIEVRH